MKRIVLFAEGEGEVEAAPKLVDRLLTIQARNAVFIDPHVFRVGEVGRLARGNYHEWKRKLAAANKRKNLGGVLLLLDADAIRRGNCVPGVARTLAQEARYVGAGTVFSVAVVFARQEYESWFIAGIESLKHTSLAGRHIVLPTARAPEDDLEEQPRNAKGWLTGVMSERYRERIHQSIFSQSIDLTLVRERMRSFRRLESAVQQIVQAIIDGKHISTP